MRVADYATSRRMVLLPRHRGWFAYFAYGRGGTKKISDHQHVVGGTTLPSKHGIKAKNKTLCLSKNGNKNLCRLKKGKKKTVSGKIETTICVRSQRGGGQCGLEADGPPPLPLWLICKFCLRVKEYAQAEEVLAGFGVDSVLASDLFCGIGVLEMAEY
jgi:hypothetical protein